jgi:hypothetical protein
MTGRLLHYLATAAACLVVLASANVTMAADTAAAAVSTDAAATPAAAPATALADPGDLTSFRDKVGQTLLFNVTGTTSGSIYGEGTYTDDSNLATAAVHAGVLSPGETKDLQVQILPGQPAYKGAFDFGVTSSSYGAWDGGSYKFLDQPMTEADVTFPDPGKLSDYRSKIGKVLKFQITGSTTEEVWGDGIYTDDSDLDTAAVEAGLVKDGEDGTVMVKILPGQGKYRAKTRNGVTTGAYAKFEGSFEFVDQDGKPLKPQG